MQLEKTRTHPACTDTQVNTDKTKKRTLLCRDWWFILTTGSLKRQCTQQQFVTKWKT